MTKRSYQSQTAAIVLAAGQGTRMRSGLPKVLHPLAGRPMIRILLDSIEKAGIEKVIVVGPDNDLVANVVMPYPTVVQAKQLGTGHAVMQAKENLVEFEGDVLVLFGGDPLIMPETLAAMLTRRRADDSPSVVVLGFYPEQRGLYGRLIMDGDGMLESIIEARDATPAQLDIGLCNSGAMCVDGNQLFNLLARIGNDNVKGEYYLTDIVALARADGLQCAVIEGNSEELMGVDNRADLARAEGVMQERLRTRAMEGGATLLGPETIYFSYDTKLGRDVTVGPHVVFGPAVTVADNVTIRPFCNIEGAKIAEGAVVGPFARLRPGAILAEDVRVGNFVEIKNTKLGKSAKVNHLTYLGDARVGNDVNIGAGTITCNYDGFSKQFTDIGAGAFIGSNTALVAPLEVGEGAIVGAGSTISRDVPADSLAVARAQQRNRVEGATNLRKSKRVKRHKKGDR